MKSIASVSTETERQTEFEDFELVTPSTPLATDCAITKADQEFGKEQTDSELEAANVKLSVDNMDNDSKKSQIYSPNRQAKNGKQTFYLMI